jgi:glycine/D-amino acid oxidase-like deaminating enzyme
MRINKSPWIHQLDHERKIVTLDRDLDTDVAIVGAGIAGVSTAFFTLKYTNKRVVLIDQHKMAHGATGHNAGQVIARFERPLAKLVHEFGFEKTKDAILDLHSGWILLDEMYTDANLNILFSRINGVRGFSDLHQVILAIKDIEIEKLSGITVKEMLINEKAPFIDKIPKTLSPFYKLVPHKQIIEMLETDDMEFQAVVSEQAACVNSALFCQEVVSYLLQKYPNRFQLYENTPIIKVVLKKNHALLDAGKHFIDVEKVILCTNGFESLEIFNEGGLAIDKKFHHLVNGRVGYMSGYLENFNKNAAAISFYVEGNDPFNDNPDPYFYLTRRQHELEDRSHNLICVGGPEVEIPDRKEYIRDYDYSEKYQKEINNFIKEVYDPDPNKKIDYQFTWHGLMGYTPNRIRLIGVEPKNPVLLYNLGCNGIGIIPSVFGGKRISKILAGEKMRPSIFDPKNH